MHAIPGVRMAQAATEATQAARYIILAVKPQHAADVCQELQPAVQDETIIISIIAGPGNFPGFSHALKNISYRPSYAKYTVPYRSRCFRPSHFRQTLKRATSTLSKDSLQQLA